MSEGVDRDGGKVALLFAGLGGSDWAGGVQELYDGFPVFAETLDAVCDCFDALLDRPQREVLFAPPGSPDAAALLDDIVSCQTGLFAWEVSLFRLVEHWGIAPHFVLGHSVGELAAAHVAGVMSLPGACAVVAARGRLLAALPPGGVMISMRASEEEVAGLLAGREHQVGIASINGPSLVVISGDEDAAGDVAARWEAQGGRTRRLRISRAFHSHHMDSVLPELRVVVEGQSLRPPHTPIISTVTGTRVTSEQLCSADYWVRNLRAPVRFFDGMRALQAEGVTTFLELGPNGVLTAMGEECLLDSSESGTMAVVPALRRDRPAVQELFAFLARAHLQGVGVHWPAVFADWDPPRRADPVGERCNHNGATTLWQRLRGLSEAEQDAAVLDVVRTAAAMVLGHSRAHDVHPDQTFLGLGFDSMIAVQFRDRLNSAMGLRLPATVVYDYPTPAALAKHLRKRIGPDRAQRLPPSPLEADIRDDHEADLDLIDEMSLENLVRMALAYVDSGSAETGGSR